MKLNSVFWTHIDPQYLYMQLFEMYLSTKLIINHNYKIFKKSFLVLD